LFSSFPFKAVLLSAEEGSNAEMLKFFKYAIYCLEKMNIEAAASLRILLALHGLGRVDPKIEDVVNVKLSPLLEVEKEALWSKLG
jgi:hypothetical protein